MIERFRHVTSERSGLRGPRVVPPVTVRARAYHPLSVACASSLPLLGSLGANRLEPVARATLGAPPTHLAAASANNRVVWHRCLTRRAPPVRCVHASPCPQPPLHQTPPRFTPARGPHARGRVLCLSWSAPRTCGAWRLFTLRDRAETPRWAALRQGGPSRVHPTLLTRTLPWLALCAQASLEWHCRRREGQPTRRPEVWPASPRALARCLPTERVSDARFHRSAVW